MPVSDAEVEAADKMLRLFGWHGYGLNALRAALEAAARVREEAELERTRTIMKALHVESLREKR